LREKTEEQFKLATTAVQEWQKAYSEEMDKVILKNEKSVQDILNTWSKLKEIDYEVPVEDPSEDGGTAGGGTGNKGKDNGVTNVKNTVDPKNADKSDKDPTPEPTRENNWSSDVSSYMKYATWGFTSTDTI
jgi:hypothetical protein